MKLAFEIHQTNAAIKIIILEIPCVPIFRQNGELWLFRPEFALKWFWGQSFKNLSPDLESASLRYYVYQLSDKRDNVLFLGSNFPKNGLWSLNFNNLSPGSESASLRYYVYQFSDKRDNFEFLGPKFEQKWILGSQFQKSNSGFEMNTSSISFVPIFCQNRQHLVFRPKFGKLPNEVQYFVSNILESVAQSWRRLKWAGYSWMELGGGWNELDRGGWSWVELGWGFT